MSFSNQVRNFRRKAIGGAGRIRRAVAIELLSSVVLDTPVDTGRARGNWQTTTKRPAQGTTERSDSDGGMVVNEIVSQVSDDVIYMTNNLPYIQRLEEGYSGQAPAGMVRKNAARIQRIIKQQAKQNNL